MTGNTESEQIVSKHIIVISQYFYPEQFRINDICEEWVKRGYKVTVLTGIPNYPEGRFYKGYGLFKKRKENYKGIDIIRIPLVARGKNSLMLALNYFSFVVSGFFWKAFTSLKADYVFIHETSPMTQALIGVWYAKKHKIPCYLYVLDLWPDNVEIVAGIKNKLILNQLGKMVDYIYRGCNLILTGSNSFKLSIEARGVKKEKVLYWPQYAEDFYKPMEKCKAADGKFSIIFAGNIGYAQGLDVLPKAAEIIKAKGMGGKIVFNIVGDGRYKEDFVKIIEQLTVKDMFILTERQPANKIPDLMAKNDAAILCFNESPLFRMTIPAKLQSYMACGMPVLASASGEAADIINSAECGLCGAPGDADKLAENIIYMSEKAEEELTLMGKNALKYYENNFSKEKLLDEIDRFFN
ncbi:MAG: glycosyltransferase family 4 protein [Clostridia bacterium]|nr:glycosyltransferase family 4 protein [Clostridia bacterium]